MIQDTVKSVYPVTPEQAKTARFTPQTYARTREQALADPESFFAEAAQRLDWIKPFTKIKDVSFAAEDLHIRWFEDGVLNVSVNCIDRHLPTRADDIAIIWEGDDPAHSAKITFRELHQNTCRMANVLKAHGVKKGDRVTLYLPMIPEAAYAMLACTRIGAVHSIIFGGFSAESIAGRIQDCDSTFVITAAQGVRGGKPLPLKATVHEALKTCPDVKTVLVIGDADGKVVMTPGSGVVA